MNISAWAIRNPIPVALMFLLLVLFGLTGYLKLQSNEWPDVSFPLVTVTVAQAGASPTTMESEITRKVEDAVTGLTGLEHIRSTIVEGTSITMVEFKLGTDTTSAVADVRDAVSRIRSDLPQDIQEPNVVLLNVAGDPFITYAVESPRRSILELSYLVDTTINRALSGVPGVAKVQRVGGLTREIKVTVDHGRLLSLGLSPDALSSKLRNMVAKAPGGKAELGGAEQGIRTLASVSSAEELGNKVVSFGGRSFRLDALGQVKDGVAEQRSITRLDGREIVAFEALMSKGAAMVQTEEAYREAVAELQKQLPADVKLTMLRTLADGTRASVKASTDAMILGGILATIVIAIFLRDWPSILIAGLAIPLSILPTFGVMQAIGYTLNGMTLIGLTLVVGILVDDAIVDLENIHRHMGLGKTPLQAAFEATDEIGLAVVATTLTIVAVFVPVAFMPGIPGMFFKSFGLTVAVSVLFSLLVARTATPLLAAHFLKGSLHQAHEGTAPWFQAPYLKLLGASLRHPWVTLGVAVGIFIGSCALVPFIPAGLFSNGDTGEVPVKVELPAGSSLADTERILAEVRRRLGNKPEVAHIYATAGVGNPSDPASAVGSINKGQATVLLVPKHDRTKSPSQLAAEWSKELSSIPGARVAAMVSSVSGTKPVQVILRSADGQLLARTADDLLTQMRGIANLRDVTSSLSEQAPELQLIPDEMRLAEQGLDATSLARSVRVATQGDLSWQLAKLEGSERQADIRVQVAGMGKQDLNALGHMPVVGSKGPVPLASLAELRLGQGPTQVNRYDRERQVTISANLAFGSLGDATQLVNQLPTMKALPAGVRTASDGDAKIMADIFGGFVFSLGLGMLLIYALLVLLFGSFVHPLTIMGALPLALGGAFGGLLVGGKELGMMALIGLMMLMGLVTKNSILLVEYAQRLREEGTPRDEAIMLAGRDRLRPILMTTIAMIAGMLPIALEFGEGTDRLSPMAAAVVGGLISSTLLTLVIIPAAYQRIDAMLAWFGRLFRRGGPKGGAVAPVLAEGPAAPPAGLPAAPEG